MKQAFILSGLLVLAACGADEGPADLRRSSLAPGDIKSGYAFLQPETRALQDDAFSNPGLLWVDQGRTRFHETAGEAACSTCHEENGAGLKGAAATYPAIDEETGALLNIEGRINTCRERHQGLEALDYESDDLLALTSFVASLSRGHQQAVEVSSANAAAYRQGEAYFFTRRGQFNMSCAACHNENWGKRLRGDTISQGHTNGFPAYRLEWQSLGSLHRRFQDCDRGVRAEPLAAGDPAYTALELYLAVRSRGLTIETPAVRR